jgi:hypothetical protein
VLVDAWEVDAGHEADPGGQVRVLLPTVHSQLVQPVVEHRLTSQKTKRGEIMGRQGGRAKGSGIQGMSDVSKQGRHGRKIMEN